MCLGGEGVQGFRFLQKLGKGAASRQLQLQEIKATKSWY